MNADKLFKQAHDVAVKLALLEWLLDQLACDLADNDTLSRPFAALREWHGHIMNNWQQGNLPPCQ